MKGRLSSGTHRKTGISAAMYLRLYILQGGEGKNRTLTRPHRLVDL